jgi:hypothetical protein
VNVEAGDARGHEFRHDFADAATVGHPHRFRHPEAFGLRRFPNYRTAVRREGKHTVDFVGQLGILEGGEEFRGGFPGGAEMFFGERLDRRHHGRFRIGQDVVGIDQQGFVLVGANAPAVAVLPEVHGVILVAHHGEVDFLGFACEFRNRGGFHILVLHRGEGDDFAHHAPDARPPDPGTDEHFIGFDTAFVGDDGFHLTIHDFDVQDSRVAVEFGCLGFLGVIGEGFSGAEGFGDAVAGHVVGPENFGFVDEGNFGFDFLGREQSGVFNAPGFGPAQLALSSAMRASV